MLALFDNFAGLDAVLLVMALGGTGLFLIKFLMLCLGGDHGGDADSSGADVNHADVGHDVGGDVGHDVGHAVGTDASGHGDAAHGPAHDSTYYFKLLSLQGLLAFFMGAGWIGLAARREWGWWTLPELVAQQVKAIQNLKIDKVTVWDTGGSGAAGDGTPGSGNTTARWLREMVGALPPLHDLAAQAGVKLPGILGTVEKDPPNAKKGDGGQAG